MRMCHYTAKFQMTSSTAKSTVFVLLFACVASHLFYTCSSQDEITVRVGLTSNRLLQGRVLYTFENRSSYQILHGSQCPENFVGIEGPENRNVTVQETVTFGPTSALEVFCADPSAGILAIQTFDCHILVDGALGILLIINVEPTFLTTGIIFPSAFYVGYAVEGMAGADISISTPPTISPSTIPEPNLLIPDYRLVGSASHLFRVYKQRIGCLSRPILATAGSLDREFQDRHDVTLEAYAPHSPSTIFASTTVRVIVLDRNDMAPQINSSSGLAEVTICDDALPGTAVTQFRATDDDIGNNAAVLFAVQMISIYLSVHPLSGTVFLLRSFHLQPITNTSVQLVAQDLGTPPLSAPHLVTATTFIREVDLTRPQIAIHGLGQDGLLHVPERTAVGQRVITVEIDNQNPTVSIVNTGPCNCFSLSGPQQFSGGVLFGILVATALDYESTLNGMQELRIIASNNGISERTSSVQIAVRITDENEPPFFSDDVYYVRAPEGTPVGATIGRVLATDPDSGLNGSLTYTIISSQTLVGVHQSGVIFTTTELDYEQITTAEIVMQAEDGGGLLATATVSILVTDSNDIIPAFIPANRSNISVTESQDPDQFIFQFVAVDMDSGCNGAVEYSIMHANPNVFRIDPASGLLYPQNEYSLDFETFTQAYVVVRATDLGNAIRFSAEAELFIELSPIDDEAPVIDPTDCPCFIIENVESFSCPPLSAHDPDSENVIFSFSDGQSALPFAIDSNTGVVSITSSLDREAQDSYEISITATDDSSHVSQPIILTVIVTDDNDENPTYSQNPLTKNVPSDLTPGEFVADLSAVDADVGYNSISIYEFSAGTSSNVHGDFRLDSLSGMLYTRRRLQHSSYTFNVIAMDYLSRQTSTMMVTIEVSGVKNNPPSFQLSFDYRVIPEDLLINFTVAQLTATDGDTGSNGQLTYSIVEEHSNHSGLFYIQNNILKVAQSLSGSAGRVYAVNVSASDSGSPALRGYQLLELRVYQRSIMLGTQPLEYRLGIPVCHYTGYLTEGSNTEETVTMLSPMIELDSSRNIHYTILNERESAGAFSIDQSSFVLQTQSGYRRVFNNTEAVFVTLVAQYDLHFHLCSVTVNIVDTNNNPPVFTSNEYAFEIYNIAAPDGPSVYRVDTQDADFGAINTQATFSLTGSVPFEIDDVTGVISVSGSLNARQYAFTVTAVDPGLPTMTASATVIASVQNTINSPPIFAGDFSVAVPEDRTVAKQINVSDADGSLNLQATNTFCIASGNLRNRFYVTEEVLTARNLDYESFTSAFNLSIMAYDRSLNPMFSTATFRVQVQDVNEPPVFPVPVYNVSLRESENRNTQVISVTATDKDAGLNGVVSYSIPLDVPFRIDINTGMILLDDTVNRESEDTIVFNVTARDGGTPSLSSNAVVSVVIIDINDNNPSFSIGDRTLNIPEDTEVGYEITQVVATDDDTGANGMVQYAILSGNDDRNFLLDPWTGSLTVFQYLDHEASSTSDSYSLVIQASDQGVPPRTSTPTLQLMIVITNSNDNFPVFSSTETNCEIRESTNQFLAQCSVSAVDPDGGTIMYVIVGESTFFRINSNTGMITPRTTIPAQDRMVDAEYVLQIQASDMGIGQSKASLAVVRVKVQDSNDVPVGQSARTYYIHESTVVNSFLFFAHFHDMDTNVNFSTVTYRILRSPGNFFLDGETGALFLNGSLDYETMMSPLMVGVSGSNPGGGSVLFSYSISILDVDENQFPVVFHPDCNPALVSVERTSPLGSPVITLNATGGRKGSVLSYAITGGSGTGYFQIDPVTSEVVTSFYLASVESETLTLQIRAVDNSSVFLYQAWHELTLILSRGISSKPTFEFPVIYSTPSENNRQVISVVRAGINGRSDDSIRYAISSGNDDNTFTIDPQTGAISPTQTADFNREVRSLYNMVVSASIPGTAEVSVALFVADIQDVDDFRTDFLEISFNLTVWQNFPVGSNERLVRVFAVDQDIGENGRLTYALTSTSSLHPFAIDNATGYVYLTRSLNSTSIYPVTVTAMGNGILPSPVEVTFYITVKPSQALSCFPTLSAIPNTSFRESLPRGSFITQVLATDICADPIIFRIANQTALVSILPETGEVYLASALDYETERTLEYTVELLDGSAIVRSEELLTINVINENDNRPEFTQEFYTFNLSESGVTLNQVVGRVEATDRDSPNNTLLTFSLQDSSVPDVFIVEASTGRILVSSNPGIIDREVLPMYTMTISVSDNENPLLMDFTRVTVIVRDSDDHVPSFRPSSMDVFILENVLVGDRVYTVSAFDPDTEANAMVSYELLTPSATFSLNASTGELLLAAPLDYESQPTYNLQVRGSSSNNLHLVITVVDVLDSPPVLSIVPPPASVRENYPTYSKVAQIQNSAGMARPVYFSIIGGNELGHFLVEPLTGTVRTTTPLDRENISSYQLIIQGAFGMGFESNITLPVAVDDVNDNAPSFPSSFIRFSISEHSTDHEALGNLNASDPDQDQNGVIAAFLITDSFAASVFHFDSSGNLRLNLNQQLDRENRFSKIIFPVHVIDGGTPARHSVVTVCVDVTDANDPPQFDSTEYTLTLGTPLQVGTSQFRVEAVDMDTGSNGTITYSMSGTGSEKFSIDPGTGNISVIDNFMLQRQYSLVLVATDGGGLTAAVNFNILVRECNFRNLTFLRMHRFLKVEENTPLGFVLVNDGELTVIDLNPSSSNTQADVIFSFQLPTTAFAITSETGRITVVELDREIQQVHQLVIQAAGRLDPSRIAQTAVTVTVLDVNDNPPQFISAPYSSTVTEEDLMMSNFNVLHVNATDPDEGSNAKITYSLVDSLEFSIESTIGFIRILDSTGITPQLGMYRFTVKATDQGNPPLCSTTDVTITVVNSRAPRFTQTMYSVPVSENTPSNTPIFNVTVIRSGPISLSFTRSPTVIPFSISDDGFITVVDPRLDYERQVVYNLTLRVFDTENGLDGTAVFIVRVTDYNDEIPTFDSNGLYQITVAENTTRGTSILPVNAVDRDSPPNAQITYSLRGTNSTLGAFSINQAGSISLSGELDYEEVNIYRFEVLARDSGSPSLTGTADVRITIQNVNDNRPVFEQMSYSFSVQETDQAGPTDYEVSAIDPDRLEAITYSIVQGPGSGDFIISDNGRVNLEINNPSMPQYMLNISAFDGKFYGYAALEISVEGVNTSPPIFDPLTYTGVVSEHSLEGAHVDQVFATDPDRGSNGQVAYSLQNHETFFSIDATTGIIVTAAGAVQIDRETLPVLTVLVMAVDGGFLARLAQLRVTVSDINDHAPTFNQNVYSGSTVDNEDNLNILTVGASDQDIGENARLSFSIVGDRSELPFAIRSDSGIVYTLVPPQRNFREHFVFNVIVTDNGSPPINSSSIAQVDITVVAGNSVLSFEQRRYSATIPENADLGSTVIMGLNIIASDNRTFNCERITVSDEYFAIVFLQTTMIYKVLVGVSNGIPPNNYTIFALTSCLLMGDTTTVTIRTTIAIEVQPVNDPPILRLLYEGRVRENLTSTSFPFIIPVSPGLTAIDLDPSNTPDGMVEYYLTNHNNLFLIDCSTGILSLSQALDYELQTTYSLTVEARDMGSPPLTATATIVITVEDINDNPPSFDQDAYHEDVFENAPAGSLIHTVFVTDLDSGSVHNYTILGGGFNISSNGEVRTLQPLDREDRSFYSVTIIATDGIGRASANLTVQVLDINDNSPIFNQLLYSFTIDENYPVGLIVFQVFAADEDEGNNSVVVFKPGNEFTNSTVRINGSTGEISFKESPDREEFEKFTLNVLATDIFGEMQTTVPVVVTVEDTNDNPPSFSQPVYSASVSENRPAGSTVNINGASRIVVRDPDRGINGSFLFFIVGQAIDYFSILDGDLIADIAFDRETNDSFSFLIKAVDMGSPSLSANATVHVEISDENDNSPNFPMPEYVINVPESAHNESILNLMAVDADSGSNSEIDTYTLSGIGQNDFDWERQSNGSVSIVVRGVLDHEDEQRRQYNLNLIVYDRGLGSRQGSTRLMIYITDVDDNIPEFDQPIYTATIKENATVNTAIVTVSATDRDASDQTQLFYSIVNEGNVPQIGINITSGTVFVHQSLDYETNQSYTFMVEVTGNTERAGVMIIVLDVNDNPPVFQSHLPTFNTIENKPPVFELVDLNVTDLDSDRNDITFHIESGNVQNRFEVSTTDGRVTVRESLDREDINLYTLVIVAQDNGSPSLTGSTTLTIHVDDVDDNDPVGGHQDIYIFLFHGKASVISLGEVYVNDSDIINDHSYALLSASQVETISILNNGSIFVSTSTPQVGTYFYTVSVTDHKNTQVSTTISTFVRNVSQSTMANSLRMQLAGITPQEFIDNKFLAFFNASSSILDRELLSKVDVEILSVEPAESGSGTDVTLAVVNETSGLYIPSLRVQYFLHINRHELQSAPVGVQISTESVDLCSVERCDKLSSCVNLYQYSQRDLPLGSRSVTYLGVASNHNFSCVPPLSSLCAEVSCASPARCVVVKLNGGYYEPQCLTDCSSQPCKNGGTCKEQNFGYFCQCMEGYEGRNCEMITASFFGNSYAIFPSVQGYSSGIISLEFNTRNSNNSLLLYNGRFDTEASDYISVRFIDGHACLEISYGGDIVQRRCVKSWSYLGNGLWHRLMVTYDTTQVKVAAVTYNPYKKDEESISVSQYFSLDLNGPLFVGAVPSRVMNLPSRLLNKPGFNGCLRNVVVNGVSLDFSNPIFQSNVNLGCSLETCAPNPCKNGGKCFGNGNCDCPPDFTGSVCDQDSSLATFLGDTFVQYQVISTAVLPLKRQTELTPTTYSTAQNIIALSFITKEASGTILQIGDHTDSNEHMIVEVVDSRVQLRYNLGGGIAILVLSSVSVADATQHTIVITRTENSIELVLDNSFVNRTGDATSPSSSTITLDVSSDHIFLGAQVDVRTGEMTRGFTGCLRGVKIDRKELPFADAGNDRFFVLKFPSGGLVSGCPILNVVESTQGFGYVYGGIGASIAGVIIISFVFVIICALLNFRRRSRNVDLSETRTFRPGSPGFSWQPAAINERKGSHISDDFDMKDFTDRNGTNGSSKFYHRRELSNETDFFSSSNTTFHEQTTSSAPFHSRQSSRQSARVPMPPEGFSAVNQENEGFLNSTPTSDRVDRNANPKFVRTSSGHRSVQSSSTIPSEDGGLLAQLPVNELHKKVKLADMLYEDENIDEMCHFTEEGPYEPLGSVGSLYDIVLEPDEVVSVQHPPSKQQEAKASLTRTNTNPIKCDLAALRPQPPPEQHQTGPLNKSPAKSIERVQLHGQHPIHTPNTSPVKLPPPGVQSQQSKPPAKPPLLHINTIPDPSLHLPPGQQTPIYSSLVKLNPPESIPPPPRQSIATTGTKTDTAKQNPLMSFNQQNPKSISHPTSQSDSKHFSTRSQNGDWLVQNGFATTKEEEDQQENREFSQELVEENDHRPKRDHEPQHLRRSARRSKRIAVKNRSAENILDKFHYITAGHRSNVRTKEEL